MDAGYRHFDCAYIYRNEKEIGKVLRDKIAEGVVKREDLFITTKVIKKKYISKKSLIYDLESMTFSNIFTFSVMEYDAQERRRSTSMQKIT